MEDKKNIKPDQESEKPKVWGDPEYDAKDDIYSQDKKVPYEEGESEESSRLDEGLDVPGAELDDDDEEIGEEDEENNYYSLGGDNHEDLEQSEDD